MKEISEEFLRDYKKQTSLTFSRKANYLMVATTFLCFIYLLSRGEYYNIAIPILSLTLIYGIYRELNKKCKSCGKRYEQANLKKILNGPEYSKLHQSFKIVEIQFCSTCKKYSEHEYEPPSW